MSTQQSPQRPARPTGGGGGGGGAMPTATTTTTTTTTGSNTHGGGSAGATFLRKLQAPGNSHQLVGILTLVVSGGILLVMTGMTLTATVLGMIFFAPLIVITAPIWVPVGVVVFLVVAGVLSMCGMVVGALAVGSWVYKYVRGWRPPGSDRVDYARSRIADTASHVKDYAREYGGYLQSRVKDAAPSA